MPTEVQDAICAALRSTDIDESDLRHPALIDFRPRRAGPRFAVAAVVVAIALLAGVLAIVLPRHDEDSPAPSDASSALVGNRWSVITVRDAKGKLAVPNSLKASIGFTRGGEVLGDDTVNALSGRYTLIHGGYVVRDAATTFSGYDGRDAARVRVVNAVDAMFLNTHRKGPIDPTVGPPQINVSFHGHTLTLHRGPVTLKLRALGTEPDSGPASSTPTSTH